MNDAANNTANDAANDPANNTPAPPHRTVRLGPLWRGTGWALGSVTGLLLAVALGESGTADRLGAGPCLLLVAAAVTAVALPVPYTFRLRAA
ncbi:hypothetical protein, partial [Kitasatospora sp. NPDC093558]|uniref:hypothetical protein n=1 Tax=Kitasatospora sp. NPDC093558 TaxID=3155201 RepID=UPI00341F512D